MTLHSGSGGPERLRADIDSGGTGDKIAGFDPAAAPLGTDAEAGGTPLSKEEVRRDRASQHADRSSAARNGAQPELQPDARMERKPQLAIGAAAGLAAALAFGAVMWLAVR